MAPPRFVQVSEQKTIITKRTLLQHGRFVLWAIISDDTAADEREYISPPFGCQPAAAEPFPPNSVAVEFLACLPLFFSLSSHSQLFDHEEKEEELKQQLGGNEREFSILNSARNILRCRTQIDAPNICLSNCKRVPTTQSVSSYTQGSNKTQSERKI